MFEKEARERAEKKIFNFIVRQWGVDVIRTEQTHETVEGAPHFYQNSLAKMWKEGAEYGYNKANEWHFVKDGDLPKDEDYKWCVSSRGYPYVARYEELFVSWTNRENKEVMCPYAWKEIVFPKESE